MDFFLLLLLKYNDQQHYTRIADMAHMLSYRIHEI